MKSFSLFVSKSRLLPIIPPFARPDQLTPHSSHRFPDHRRLHERFSMQPYCRPIQPHSLRPKSHKDPLLRPEHPGTFSERRSHRNRLRPPLRPSHRPEQDKDFHGSETALTSS